MKKPYVVRVVPYTEVERAQRAKLGFNDGAVKWVAEDSRGFLFLGMTKIEAQELAEQYHSPTHTSKERGGRVIWPDRSKDHPKPRRRVE